MRPHDHCDCLSRVVTQMAAEREGVKIKYERTADGSLMNNIPPPSDALGTVTFPVFSWFGITGRQVAFTSTKPLAMFGPLLPVDVALFPGPSPPTPPTVPPTPAPQSPSSSGARPSGPFQHTTWQLGLLISCTVLAAGLLLVTGLWIYKRLRGDRSALCLEVRCDGAAWSQKPCITAERLLDNHIACCCHAPGLAQGVHPA